MPIVGSGQAAAQLVKAAEDAVKASWRAKNRVLTSAEQEQMLLEIRSAGLEALFAHIAANAVVAVVSVSGVTTGPGVSGPGAGTVG